VLFDVDDTLFDYTASEKAGLLAHLTAEALLDLFPSPADAFLRWRQLMTEEYARFLSGELTFAGQQRARTRRFLDRPELGDEDASAWFARFAARRGAVATAFDDAEPVLRRLAPAYRLGVVSNAGAENQRRKLASLGLLRYLGGAFVCCDEHGAAKPEAGIFLAGCAALGLPPHEVAYVGNDHAVDAVGARDAGLRAYWLRRGPDLPDEPAADGVHVLRTLHDLPAALLA
jgi:putative hydrolase of the HAD superfamily